MIAPGESETATTQQVVIYRNLDLITSAIAEAEDIEGVQAGDTSIAVAVAEYGNALQDTKKLRALARTDIPAAFQELIGRNAGLSQEAWARGGFIGGNLYRRPTASDTRAQLDTTADALTATGVGYGFFYSLVAQLRSAMAPPLGMGSEAAQRKQGAGEGGEYGTVLHDLLIGDLQGCNGWTPIQYVAAPDARQMLYNGEIAKLAGIRIVESPLGKIYQSAGTIAQTATSLSSATVVGQTSIIVASATGLAAGDYVTVGTLETGTTETTDLETALVTSVSSTTLTVIGTGPEGGLRYAHAAAAAVSEGAFVAAIPVFGGMSVAKVHSSLSGPKPTMVKTGPFDKLGRFQNYGWWWLGGYGRTVPTWLIRGEVAVTGKCIAAYSA